MKLTWFTPSSSSRAFQQFQECSKRGTVCSLGETTQQTNKTNKSLPSFIDRCTEFQICLDLDDEIIYIGNLGPFSSTCKDVQNLMWLQESRIQHLNVLWRLSNFSFIGCPHKIESFSLKIYGVHCMGGGLVPNHCETISAKIELTWKISFWFWAFSGRYSACSQTPNLKSELLTL